MAARGERSELTVDTGEGEATRSIGNRVNNVVTTFMVTDGG